ncbi:cystathionine beta-synthase [Winogradskyella sp. PC-19]|uniref:PLP-dependent transferase n=1 Tax=unclassified Winogradskyella TaxID=2615021 RepID=UPI000B3D20E0|nr:MULTISPECIES: PLP-dependent transferase [unclassified Winogradskyella]ARV09208.1 cystathionine beta-synthase [Winogradskyella sp. PC-19]RZN82528.1 MAG: cystathionine beta-synthase [Winogradskyella sp.]
MQDQNTHKYIKAVLKNMPSDWLNLTTHRLDIYNEALAKTEFSTEFEKLYQSNNSGVVALNNLPTAYDYIRLGHPLSSILEWAIAKAYSIASKQVISFSSQTMPIQAILRKNLLENKKTLITYSNALPREFNDELLKTVYGYSFELKQVESPEAITEFDGSLIFVSQDHRITTKHLNPTIDFQINLYENLGSILSIHKQENSDYVSEIQHVRRRESIAMTPHDTLTALKHLVEGTIITNQDSNRDKNKTSVLKAIQTITGTDGNPLVGSSGLSVQYAIMMGLIDDAQQNHPNKAIKFIVPTNCYGGTNDQARRVAACNENVAIVDLEVDGDNDMVSSLKTVLDNIAKQDAIPYIIAEIPTNPRVEVPDLEELKSTLTKERTTLSGAIAIEPVFILDQTFCPNIQFLAEGEILSTGKAISYASGSKFPSGGKCTAGYCVGNSNSESLMEKIAIHLSICDNEATDFQYQMLAEQMPSMNQRIVDAYKNTRDFVSFIEENLPDAKINFVSEELAERGFTPSVFSLDLPTKGNTDEEREAYKRQLNHKLINLMITKIPEESKYCVSYGQLKGCYWTIPATSTQGTTKEGDKDYIARVALSGNMDLERHKAVFKEFVADI